MLKLKRYSVTMEPFKVRRSSFPENIALTLLSAVVTHRLLIQKIENTIYSVVHTSIIPI